MRPKGRTTSRKKDRRKKTIDVALSLRERVRTRFLREKIFYFLEGGGGDFLSGEEKQHQGIERGNFEAKGSEYWAPGRGFIAVLKFLQLRSGGGRFRYGRAVFSSVQEKGGIGGGGGNRRQTRCRQPCRVCDNFSKKRILSREKRDIPYQEGRGGFNSK